MLIRYREIKKTLQDDAALFESNIKKLDEELHLQSLDIERLQNVFIFSFDESVTLFSIDSVQCVSILVI